MLGASRGLVDPPDTARYPEVAATVEAGDVLVHHTNVIHRTGPNLTGSHRRNLGFTYHGAGAVQDTEANAASARMVERYNRSPPTAIAGFGAELPEALRGLREHPALVLPGGNAM